MPSASRSTTFHDGTLRLEVYTSNKLDSRLAPSISRLLMSRATTRCALSWRPTIVLFTTDRAPRPLCLMSPPNVVRSDVYFTLLFVWNPHNISRRRNANQLRITFRIARNENTTTFLVRIDNKACLSVPTITLLYLLIGTYLLTYTHLFLSMPM